MFHTKKCVHQGDRRVINEGVFMDGVKKMVVAITKKSVLFNFMEVKRNMKSPRLQKSSTNGNQTKNMSRS